VWRYFEPKTGEPDPEKVHDAWQRIDEEQDIRQDREDDSIERESAARHPTSSQ
jgi:hypothetical protein